MLISCLFVSGLLCNYLRSLEPTRIFIESSPETGHFRLGAAQVDLLQLLGLTPDKLANGCNLTFDGTLTAERIGQVGLGGRRQVHSASSAADALLVVEISLKQLDAVPDLEVTFGLVVVAPWLKKMG